MEQRFNYVLIDVNQPMLKSNMVSRLDDCVKRYIDYRNEREVQTGNYNLIWVRSYTFFKLCLEELER